MKSLIIIAQVNFFFYCFTQAAIAKIGKIKIEAPKKVQTQETSYSNSYQSPDFNIFDPFGPLDGSE